MQNVSRIIERKIKKLGKLDEKVLENIRAGDTEFIFETIESVDPLVVLRVNFKQEIPTGSLKRLLIKIKQRTDFLGFLKSLSEESLYLLITKLEEYDYNEDSSVFYAELWGDIPNSEQIIQFLLDVKVKLFESSFQDIFKFIL